MKHRLSDACALYMYARRQKIPMTDHLRMALEDLGGGPLGGSGFEDETPDSDFSDREPVAPEPRQ